MQRKRIRDADGNVVGYGDPEPARERKGGSRKGDAGRALLFGDGSKT